MRAPLPALLLALTACGGVLGSPPVLHDPSAVDPEVFERAELAVQHVLDDPSDAARWLELGMLYDAHGLTAEAARSYEGAVERDDTLARGWYHLARMRADAGAVGDALDALERAIVLAPDHAAAHWRRGNWLLDLDRRGEARAAYERARTLDPGAAEPVYGLAKLAIADRRPGDALGPLERYLTDRPRDLYAHTLRGMALRDVGRTGEAEREFAIGQGFAPAWADPWTAELDAYRAGESAAMERALAEIRAGRAEAAIARLEALHRAAPDNVTLQGMLAAAYAEADQFAQALELLDRARERNPDHYRIELNLGITYARMDDRERALEHTRRAIELHGRFGAAHHHLGVLLAEADPAAAADAFERALRLGYAKLDTMLRLGIAQRRLGQAEQALETFALARHQYPYSRRAAELYEEAGGR